MEGTFARSHQTQKSVMVITTFVKMPPAPDYYKYQFAEWLCSVKYGVFLEKAGHRRMINIEF